MLESQIQPKESIKEYVKAIMSMSQSPPPAFLMDNPLKKAHFQQSVWHVTLASLYSSSLLTMC